eukprot:CAMPEP_0114431814 /NCGR_PEP_ID=MMETSP0103-20121206/10813_1 /TAXON_ID=37642 ORGANISM="Paraphysomonas imperforata, Strain PA2" /NCGR_SAMPLE_ID=MMETSP0103 /ASSEMBLY_ACC=CAM_ASM_000201 /LENGTH=151 /DNA_ID=CAMNT_0001601429 /DNA_START=57 /DNA_END=512 /DNA_ORIENTATION=-
MSTKQGLSEDMSQELMATFKMLDQNDEGSIDFNKMTLALKVHGFEPSAETLAQIKKMETIGPPEYMTFMGNFLSESGHWCKNEVQEAFDVFDKERTATITIPQIKRVINRIGEKLTDPEIDQQYFQFDMNNDMALDIGGFTRAVTSEAKTF